MTAQKPHGPLLHASQFCDAFRQWAKVCMEPREDDDEHMQRWRKDFRDAWGFMQLAISKSCLLDRLIYGGDQLRTEPCPVHKGHWSGITNPPCEHCGVGPCSCNTGWLPAKFDQEKIRPQSVLEIMAQDGATGPASESPSS